jgi:hypothetical protein
VAGVYWLYGDKSGPSNSICTGKPCVADFTPKINNRERCRFYGFLINGQPRQSCPTVPDGDPRRLESEIELMGGPFPVWQSEGVIRGAGDKWKYIVKGGRGSIRACYANGKVCSRWLDVR